MSLKNFLKKWVIKNFQYKLLAFLIAVVLWFIVMHVDNYMITKTIYGIPVETLNGEAIEETGNLYAITDGETVDIIVKGERSIVDELRADDFKATADLSKLSLTNAAKIDVKAMNGKVSEAITITCLNEYVNLSIEPMVEKNLSISIYPEGNVASGFALGNMVATPNLITVSGPETVIDKIVTVRAVVNVQNTRTSFSTEASLVCLDSSGNAINAKQVKLSSDKVDVSVAVYPVKSVNVSVKSTGNVADGYKLEEITYNPDVINVAGEVAVLDALSAIEINDISVAGKSEDYELNVDITDYLPEGVMLADENTQIAIKVTIAKIVQKVISVTTSDLSLLNASDDLEYRVVIPGSYRLMVSATEDDIQDIDISDLELSLDVKDLKAGTHEVVVNYKQSEDYTVTMNGAATVIIKNKEEGGE